MGRALRFYYQCNSQFSFACSNFRFQQIPSRHYSNIKGPGKITSKLTSAYINYLDKFENKFKKSLPTAHRLFRLFKDGVADFFRDAKEYYSVSRSIWSGTPLSNFKCNQLQLYQQMPGDLIKSAPLIISIPIPLVTYVIFPVAYYMYPQYLLCRHFWTEEQKKIFGVEDFESRVVHYLKIFQYLEKHLQHINDSYTRSQFECLLNKIKQANEEIRAEDVLKFKDLFTTLPFGMEHLTERHKIHLWHLSRGLEISTRRSKIIQDLRLFSSIDAALHREGIDNVEMKTLYEIGLMRGINPYEVSKKDLKRYLENWIKVSTNIDEASYSLLLHCPVLLSPFWFKQVKIPQI